MTKFRLRVVNNQYSLIIGKKKKEKNDNNKNTNNNCGEVVELVVRHRTTCVIK